MSKDERARVFSLFDGHCAYCGKQLVNGWHVDHMEALIRDDWIKGREGNPPLRPHAHRPDNLFPACAPCNINKSSLTLDYWRNHRLAEIPRFLKRIPNYKLALAYGLVTETGAPVVFHFERMAQGGRD